MSGTWVVSDVHGHLDDLRTGLADAGLTSADGDWAGDDTSLWVLGDLVDRGPDGIGVIRFLRGLQEQAPDQVHVLLGNHEALMLGERLFPGPTFDDVWQLNGGQRRDQQALTEDDVAWLRGLPPMALVGEHLLVHSDITEYLDWGDSVEAVNEAVAALLAGDDAQQHFDVFATLTGRYAFAGTDGASVARHVLDVFGGSRLVHGHSIIGTLVDQPSYTVTEPLAYADGLVLAVDGGRYDDGPLLLVRLD